MASGLVALLDDIAGIAKLAAASLDDVGAAAAKAGTKSAGVVIDDTAVTPSYVTGLDPARELPIIWRIARGSLFNKIVILLPAALALSYFLPWAITPILMVGGAYLAFEATEKIWAWFAEKPHEEADALATLSSKEVEDQKVAGAVRTDLILSAEIMAIALGELGDQTILNQAIALLLVGVAITVAVYGAVALIVKMDDIGLHLAKAGGASAALGRGLVLAMPKLMKLLSVVGTLAMLWVGGGIIVHGLEEFGLGAIPHFIHDAGHAVHGVPGVGPFLDWLVQAGLSGIVGLVVGAPIAFLVTRFLHKH